MSSRVVELDHKIREKFLELQVLCEKYSEVVNDIKSVQFNIHIVNNEIQDTITTVDKHIKYITNAFNFYMMESCEILDKVREGDTKCLSDYISIAKNYIHIVDPSQPSYQLKKSVKIICSVCKNSKFDVINTTHICQTCGNQKDVFNISPSYKDSSRINTALRYTYKRRIHFKDCINQYQGKQNANINESVYEALREKIKQHELNMADVTKDHILMFLKDTENSRHYEDINLIYRTLTNKQVDDIGYLEDIIIHDFNVLSDLYDKRFKQTNRITRKSFINTQYILFQLLRRHNHKCKREDFNILKTVDRKSLHEDILSELFDELGWNFTSLF